MMDFKGLYSKRIKQQQLDKNKPKNQTIINNENELINLTEKSKKEKIDIINEELKSSKQLNKYEFEKPCSAYLRVEHALDIDYKNELTKCKDRKELLLLFSLLLLDREDYIITTTPNNNYTNTISKYFDCNVYQYRLKKFNNYLIDFEEIDEKILKKCKLLYINYPNNPTGAVANKAFYKEVIKYAKKYNFIVVNDASYIDLCFDEISKVSLLSIEGAKDVGVEFYNVSNLLDISTINEGFIAGNRELIRIYETIKRDLMGEGYPFYENITIESLNNCESVIKDKKERYLKCHNLFKESLKEIGFNVKIPKAGYVNYLDIPKVCNGVKFESASEFALWLEEKENIIVTPFDEENCVSICLNFDCNDEEESIFKLIIERLKKYKFN